MAPTLSLKIFFSMFIMYLPTLLVCGVALFMISTRWRQAPAAFIWALFGFGLALFLCFATPIGHTLLQSLVMQSELREGRMWMFTAFSGMTSLLHAAIYAFLLVAILTGRETATDQPRDLGH